MFQSLSPPHPLFQAVLGVADGTPTLPEGETEGEASAVGRLSPFLSLERKMGGTHTELVTPPLRWEGETEADGTARTRIAGSSRPGAFFIRLRRLRQTFGFRGGVGVCVCGGRNPQDPPLEEGGEPRPNPMEGVNLILPP